MKTQQFNGERSDSASIVSSDVRGIDSAEKGATNTHGQPEATIGESLSDATEWVTAAASAAKDTVVKAAGTVASTVADSVGASANRLEEGWNWGKKLIVHPTVSKASNELCSIVRRYPLQSFLGALTVGIWLGGKTTCRRSPQSRE
jgi:hypothetical protein